MVGMLLRQPGNGPSLRRQQDDSFCAMKNKEYEVKVL